MIAALDVHYRPDRSAKAVCLVFDRFDAPHASATYEAVLHDVADYQPGEFYRRELPCLLQVLALTDTSALTCLVIDGYVFLDDTGKPGLGWHLHQYFQGKIPVVGVAKTSFHNNLRLVRPVLRGTSRNPLYVSSIGIDVDIAAAHVRCMDGPYRMPDLLKLVDGKTKAEQV
jgi:deoxyribonuclease V